MTPVTHTTALGEHVRETTAAVTANVRAETARAQLAYAQVAEKIGMDARTFRKSTRGERPWQLDELVAVAHVLDVPLIELFRFPTRPAPPADTSASS